MKAKIKLVNPNGTGANSYEDFDSIVELKNYLNAVLYYSSDVLLWVDCFFDDHISYGDTNDIRSLLSEANHYDSILCVAPQI